MPAEPAPGQAAYEVMYRASGVDVRWEDLDGDDQRLWDDIAAAVAAPLNAEITRLRGQLAAAPEVWRGRCASHAAEEHVQVRTNGHWMCVIGLRGLDDGWRELTAMQRERDTLRERLAGAEAIARECEAELQEVHAVLVTAYGHEDLSEDTPTVVAALAAERDRLREEAASFRGQLAAIVRDGHWLTAGDDGTLDTRKELLATRKAVREALEGGGEHG